MLIGRELMLSVDIGGVILAVLRPADPRGIGEADQWCVDVYPISGKHSAFHAPMHACYAIQYLLTYGGEVERTWCKQSYPEYCTEEFARKDIHWLECCDVQRFDYAQG